MSYRLGSDGVLFAADLDEIFLRFLESSFLNGFERCLAPQIDCSWVLSSSSLSLTRICGWRTRSERPPTHVTPVTDRKKVGNKHGEITPTTPLLFSHRFASSLPFVARQHTNPFPSRTDYIQTATDRAIGS